MSLVSRLLDLIFPPRCSFCGALVDTVSAAPCWKCKKADFWLEGPSALFPGTHMARCVCAGWYRDELREAVLRFKFEGRAEYAKAYGPALAKQIRRYLPGAYDCITWVPVSPETLEQRGYDQARLLAEEAARALGEPAVSLLVKSGKNRRQSSLERGEERRDNVKGVYSVPDPSAVAGARVLIIDDILTTGATLEEASRTLREAGAAQVVAAAFCKTP